MAEFIEVTKNANRLCESMGVGSMICKLGCPLNRLNNGRDTDCISFREKYPEEYEAIVMKWAEEHPVQTNKDKLMEIITNTFDEEVARLIIGNKTDHDGFCANCQDSCYECKYDGFFEREYKEQKNESK